MNPTKDRLSENVTVKWHHDGKIAEYDMSKFTLKHAVIDNFFANFQEFIVTNFPDGRVLSIHDFTSHRLPPFSSYFKQRSREVSDAFPGHFFGRSAVLLRSTPLTHVYRLAVRSMNNAQARQHKIEREVFTDRQKAMAWLEELLASE